MKTVSHDEPDLGGPTVIAISAVLRDDGRHRRTCAKDRRDIAEVCSRYRAVSTPRGQEWDRVPPTNMLDELRNDNRTLTGFLRGAHDLCD